MEKLTFDNVKPTDIDDVMFIEQHDFSADEAASRESMIERIENTPDTFLVARNENGRVVGFIASAGSSERYLTDDFFEHTRKNLPTDKFLEITSLAIHPDYQGLGIGKKLLSNLTEVAKAQHRLGIGLTCHDYLVPYYEAHGFVDEGRSASQLAGEEWYNMVLEFEKNAQ